MKRTLIRIIFFLLMAQKNKSTCPTTDKNCLICSEARCLACADGYLKNTTCVPSHRRISNCLTYTSPFECQVCAMGYYATASGACEKILIPNCLISDQSGLKCQSCGNTTLINGTSCQGKNNCSDVNCQICGVEGRQEYCGMCKSGHSLQFNNKEQVTCMLNNPILGSCLISNQTACIMCDYNSYYSNGSCLNSTTYHLNIFGACRNFFVASIELILWFMI